MQQHSTKASQREITYVGIDAHKKEHVVCILYPGALHGHLVRIPNQPREVRRLVKKIVKRAPGAVRMCYEAGPCGFTLQRQIQEAGAQCVVIAPALIPVKAGERVKTDRRDAYKLAVYLQSDLLTEVVPPTPQEEAARDLCRCREAARIAQSRARQQLSKFLLRRGCIYGEGVAWTQKHERWLHTLSFPDPLDQEVFEEYVAEVAHGTQRLARLDRRLEALAREAPYAEAVGWLRCFRGVDTVTALTFVTELYRFGRFGSPRELMAFLGLTPREHSSGEKQKRGGITKTGNRRVRRVLVEAAAHYDKRSPKSGAVRKRRQDQPAWVINVAEQAEERLHQRYGQLRRQGKERNVAVVAVARELAGFLWSVVYVQAEEVHPGRESAPGQRRPVDCAAAAGA